VEIPAIGVSLAVSFLATVAAGTKAMWSYIRGREEQCQKEKAELREELHQSRAETKAEMLDHLKTLRISDALAKKLERVTADSSRPPPKS
jgi:predicted nuclease with TOPRIM domain